MNNSQLFLKTVRFIVLAGAFFLAACSPLLNAARSGNIVEARKALDSGADVNENFNGETALIYASIQGNTELAQLLLERGASVNASMGYGLTPLVYALARNHGTLAQQLITHGADVEGARAKLSSLGSEGVAGLGLLERLTKQPSTYEQVTQRNAPAFNTVLPYQPLAAVPPGLPLPIDGLWTINQGRMRIAAGRMYFTNRVPGIARENQVNIKDIRQTGANTYALNGFVSYNDKGYYVPGEFNVVSKKALLLTLYPKPELGLPNGYNEVYTREKLDDEALFASQLTIPTAVTSDKTGGISIPNFKSPPDHNAVAIVIGIEKYQSLPTAGFVRSDAGLMREYLKAMGYQDRNIEFLTDDRATFTSIRKAIETWLPNRINTQSRVTVYYAGHGAPDPQSGEAYIVPYDGDPNYLPDTGYPLKRLYERLEKLPAKQVVVMIDACFSGAGGRGVLAAGARSLVRIEKAKPKGARIVVLTSTQGSQISTSSPDKKHGLFTYYLLKALQENNQDLSAVFDYLKPRVEDEAKRMNVEQTPSISQESSAIKGVFRLW